MRYSIHVNGERQEVDLDGETPLLWVLRDIPDLNGRKYGCGIACCEACTVHVNGEPYPWASAPASMVGQGVSVAEICQQRNGNRTLVEIHRHMAVDNLTGWAWNPSQRRKPAPNNWAQFEELIRAWTTDTGVHCPGI